MPHLVIQHTPSIKTDFKAQSERLLETLRAICDEQGMNFLNRRFLSLNSKG